MTMVKIGEWVLGSGRCCAALWGIMNTKSSMCKLCAAHGSWLRRADALCRHQPGLNCQVSRC